jgi:hypothetical protein
MGNQAENIKEKTKNNIVMCIYCIIYRLPQFDTLDNSHIMTSPQWQWVVSIIRSSDSWMLKIDDLIIF